MNKTYRFSTIFILIFGITFVIGTIIALGYFYSFKKNSNKIVGTVIDSYSSEDYSYTIIEFELNEEYKKTKLNFYSSSLDIGDNITLYCHTKTNKIMPRMIMILFPSIFGSLGVIFASIGVILLIPSLKVLYFRKNKDTMDKVIAIVTEVKLNNNISVNGVHPFRLFYHARYNNKELDLKSQNIYEFIESKPNGIVDVYFKNEKKYFIDTDSYRENNNLYEESVK